MAQYNPEEEALLRNQNIRSAIGGTAKVDTALAPPTIVNPYTQSGNPYGTMSAGVSKVVPVGPTNVMSTQQGSAGPPMSANMGPASMKPASSMSAATSIAPPPPTTGIPWLDRLNQLAYDEMVRNMQSQSGQVQAATNPQQMPAQQAPGSNTAFIPGQEGSPVQGEGTLQPGVTQEQVQGNAVSAGAMTPEQQQQANQPPASTAPANPYTQPGSPYGTDRQQVAPAPTSAVTTPPAEAPPATTTTPPTTINPGEFPVEEGVPPGDVISWTPPTNPYETQIGEVYGNAFDTALGKALPANMEPIMAGIKQRQGEEQNQLEEMLALRGISNSSIADDARQQLAIKQRNEEAVTIQQLQKDALAMSLGVAQPAWQQGMAERSQEFGEFNTLLSQDQAIRQYEEAQQRLAIQDMLAVMGLTTNPMQLPYYQPAQTQAGAGAAVGNIAGNVLNAAISNPNFNWSSFLGGGSSVTKPPTAGALP